MEKKRKTKDGDSRRSNKFLYYVKSDSGVDINVCKKFFLAILGYPLHNDRIIRDVLNKTDPKDLIVKPLKRGHPSEKKIDRQLIIDHINSFGPRISHYRREHAPNRKYLPSDINIKLMHTDFLSKHPQMNVSYELYRQQVAGMNISFAVLGHEECWQCEKFDLHSKISKHEKKILILIARTVKYGNAIMKMPLKPEMNIKMTFLHLEEMNAYIFQLTCKR